MPRIWSETIAAHRDAVREATLSATAALVAEHGLTGVTMSQIAKDTGIGRATLYKYFPDVESILRAWHERRIDEHLQQLLHIRDQIDDPGQRLKEVLAGYASAISHRRQHDSDLAAMLHSGEHVAAAHQRLRAFITDLLADAAAAGAARQDTPADELALYCLHALAAAASMHSPDAVHRLVQATLAGLNPTDPDTATGTPRRGRSHP